ncbi:MAG: enoyl-CoA hydratase/isomerase family protein [Promethearchaeia archaeon]
MNIEDLKDIIYKKEENGICTAIINRPERRNAMTQITFLEIETILEDMEKDRNSRVLILTGSEEGKAFSSGGYFDAKFFSGLDPELKKQIDVNDIAQKRLCLKLWNFTKPIIAAINGLAIGSGATIPLVGADLIYMADDAWLGFYFVKRALSLETGSSFIMPFLLGFQRAKEILYFGDNISAQKAYDLGLINGVVPHEELMSHCRKIAERLIPPKGPSVSIRMMKKIMHDYFRPIIERQLDLENQAIKKTLKTRDFRESTIALKEKRDPVFKGR